MKKYFLLLISICLICCQSKWTEKNKSDLLSSCIAGATKDMGATKAKAYCQCMLEKIVRKYPNADDARYLQYDTAMRRMGKDCLQQR
ncbi:MAG: hypothetical protein ACJ75B_21130 [Flavisolibacter sp.]